MKKLFIHRSEKRATSPLNLLWVALLVAAPVAMPISGYAQTNQQTATKTETFTITGTVKGSDGNLLAGATVAIKGTSTGTLVDAKGKFTLKVKPNAILEISFIGYKTQSLNVGSGTRTSYTITLQEDKQEIEGVVVIGYGTVKKNDLTGSVSNVKMQDVEGIPVLSIDQALQGRIAGADIMSTTGEPGAKTSIRIRGTRSITAGNEPLFVVDGVMDAISDLGDINPDDIESVSVLKDASSTAIYGSRGSNGVIIVTTKKGKKGGLSISLKTNVGFSQLPKGLDIMDASEFAIYRNNYAYFSTTDNNADIGGDTPMSKYPYPDPYSLGKGTDWIKAITHNGVFQSYNLSLSGNNEKTNYYASFGFDDTQGIIINSGMARYTGRINIDHKLSKKFKVGVRLAYTHRDHNNNTAEISSTSWWQAAMYLSPTIDLKGNFNDLWYSGQVFNSPYAKAKLMVDKNKRITGNYAGYAEWEIIKGLKLKSQVSVYDYRNAGYEYTPSYMPGNTENVGGSAYRGEYHDFNILSENTLFYQQTFNKKHNFDILAGFTAQKSEDENLSLSGSGYLVDDLLWNNMGAIPDKLNLSPSTSKNEGRRMSLLARANYNYDSRYYLTVTARRDGATNFAEGHKWAFFPSAAIRWNISSEKFMKNVKWIEELSLRASAGRTGNDAISSYRSIAAMGSTTNGYLFGEQQPVAYYPSRIASPKLTWETTDMYTVAIDGSFLKGRLNVTGEIYLSKTKDLLLNVQRPSHTGYSTRLMNIGRTSNKGFEVSIESRNIVQKDFSWTTSFTMSHNSQNVDNISHERQVSVYNSYTSGYMMYGYVKDYPLNSLWGFVYGGTWKNEEEVARNKRTKTYVSTSSSTYTPGCARYLDMDHNGVINEKDLVYMGNADPWLYGGLQNTFRYKKFSLGVYFNYSLGGKIYNIAEQFMGTGGTLTNQYRYMLDSWHPVRNPNSETPRAGASDNIVSDRMLHDATFLRLKNISASYTFDISKLTRNLVKSVMVSVSGDNIYLWKKYNGFDPEVSTSSENSALRRLDAGAYPKPRTITFSLQFKY